MEAKNTDCQYDGMVSTERQRLETLNQVKTVKFKIKTLADVKDEGDNGRQVRGYNMLNLKTTGQCSVITSNVNGQMIRNDLSEDKVDKHTIKADGDKNNRQGDDEENRSNSNCNTMKANIKSQMTIKEDNANTSAEESGSISASRRHEYKNVRISGFTNMAPKEMSRPQRPRAPNQIGFESAGRLKEKWVRISQGIGLNPFVHMMKKNPFDDFTAQLVPAVTNADQRFVRQLVREYQMLGHTETAGYSDGGVNTEEWRSVLNAETRNEFHTCRLATLRRSPVYLVKPSRPTNRPDTSDAGWDRWWKMTRTGIRIDQNGIGPPRFDPYHSTKCPPDYRACYFLAAASKPPHLSGTPCGKIWKTYVRSSFDSDRSMSLMGDERFSVVTWTRRNSSKDDSGN